MIFNLRVIHRFPVTHGIHCNNPSTTRSYTCVTCELCTTSNLEAHDFGDSLIQGNSSAESMAVRTTFVVVLGVFYCAEISSLVDNVCTS